MTFLALINRLPPADQSLANNAADAQLRTVAILAAKIIDRYVHDKHPRIVDLFDESKYFSPRTLREIIGSESRLLSDLAEDNVWFGIWQEMIEAIRQRFPDRFASSESILGRKTTKELLQGRVRIGTLIENPSERWRDRAFDFKTSLEILGELVGEMKGTAKRKPRRRASGPKPLTSKQVEAMLLVGEHKGNIAAAARAAGVDRKTLEQHYLAANKKAGVTVVQHGTRQLATDRRGQVTATDDRRKDL